MWQAGRPFSGTSVIALSYERMCSIDPWRGKTARLFRKKRGKGHCVSTWPHFFDRSVTSLIDRRRCQRPLSILNTAFLMSRDSVPLSRTITVRERTYILVGVRCARLSESSRWWMLWQLQQTEALTSLSNKRCLFDIGLQSPEMII